MKRQPFLKRLGFAAHGIITALKTESSFRFQLLATAGVFIVLCFLRPEPVWWCVLLLTCAAVLAAELFNTSLEFIVDRLHPDIHPLIAASKDCAAGAVLVLSVVSLIIFVFFIASHINAVEALFGK